MYFKYPFVQRKIDFGNQNFLVHGEHTWKVEFCLPRERWSGKVGERSIVVEGCHSMGLCHLGEECVHSQVGVVLRGDSVGVHMTHSPECV